MSSHLLLFLFEQVDIPLGLVCDRNVEPMLRNQFLLLLLGIASYIPSAVLLANRGNLVIVLLGQLDLLKVGMDSRLLDTLGDDGVAAVCAPGHEDLSGSCTKLLRDLFHNWVLSQFGLANHWYLCQIFLFLSLAA